MLFIYIDCHHSFFLRLQVLILRNHGVVTGGETIEEALYLMHNVVSACESQIKLMVVGIENMQMLSEEAIKQVRSIIKSAGVQVQGKPDDGDKEQKTDEAKARKWKIWDLEFEARMRMLDNAVTITRLMAGSISRLMHAFRSRLLPCSGLPDRLFIPTAFATE